MSLLNIPSDELDSWLAELKPYQQNALRQFLGSMQPEDAAEKWITTIGSPNIAGFGGAAVQDPKPFLDRFKAECRKFICDDEAYSDEKKELLENTGVSKALIISTMSGVIGAALGTPGTLIAPAVTLVLFTVGRISRNAYCAV